MPDGEASLRAQLRLACALCRFPIGAVYRFEGGRARLLHTHAETDVLLPEDVPAWRAQRDGIGLVEIVGRGPAAPESAIFPAELCVSALISAPLRRGEEQVGVLLMADAVPREDVAFIDLHSLQYLCDEVARGFEPNLGSPAGLVSGPPGDSAVWQTAEEAAWPLRDGSHDPVTGLPDRRMLLTPISLALADAQRRQNGVALVILALDRFSRINDWLGRDVGDDLLRQCAERLVDSTEDEDLIGRGSGDEFYAVLAGRPRGNASLATAHRLAQAIRAPFHVRGYELAVSASLGIARFPDDAGDATTLMRYAEIALHRAKSSRTRGRIETFSEELRRAVERRGDTERQLRRALGAGELLLHYQPKVDLKTRRVRALEALIRWRRNGEMISPGHFLPVAEESGLIVPIGAWVLLEAARQMKRWVERGLPIESVSVNVSALQFARPDFMSSTEAVLNTAGLHPAHLELEVTETSLMDDIDLAIHTLSRLRTLGMRISVDDFGTGYSSLSYLQRLPVDVLKIDRAFVKDLDGEEPQRGQARALAEAIHALGHSLGLRVLAEGVETTEQLTALEGMGCDEVQGYYFARPLPADEVEAFVLRTAEGRSVRPT
ncbi:MAG: putative bifunctional diguanylate cyclase/phosphodiesterase [Sandaracinaceae bacterium]